MRAVLTRVKSASVAISGETVGKIDKGFLILLGVGPNDTEEELKEMKKEYEAAYKRRKMLMGILRDM